MSGPYDRSESIPLPPKLLHLLVVISRFVRVSGAIDETRRLLRVLLNPEPENRIGHVGLRSATRPAGGRPHSVAATVVHTVAVCHAPLRPGQVYFSAGV